MKIVLLICFYYVIFLSLNAQTVVKITNNGTTFSPATVDVILGDIVQFEASSAHPVVQVSESTWNSNGTTVLPGGFNFPTGAGSFTPNTMGTIYYVCTAHVELGMKGKIFVSGTLGIEKTEHTDEFKILPNPANDFISIQNFSNVVFKRIKIIDISGRTVLDIQEPNNLKDNFMLDIKNLNKGIYFVSIISGDKKYTRKFMKQ